MNYLSFANKSVFCENMIFFYLKLSTILVHETNNIAWNLNKDWLYKFWACLLIEYYPRDEMKVYQWQGSLTYK